jgi:hypothetical protein
MNNLLLRLSDWGEEPPAEPEAAPAQTDPAVDVIER